MPPFLTVRAPTGHSRVWGGIAGSPEYDSQTVRLQSSDDPNTATSSEVKTFDKAGLSPGMADDESASPEY